MVVGISKNEEMMAAYEQRYLLKEKEKKHSLTIEEMGDRPINGGLLERGKINVLQEYK